MQVAALAERDQLLDDRTQVLGLGRVVTICSCLMSAAAMLANIALRCSVVRLNRRPEIRDAWLSPDSYGRRAKGRPFVLVCDLSGSERG